MQEETRDVDEQEDPNQESEKEGVDERGTQGSKQADNPDPDDVSEGEEGGLGGATGALGGDEPVEPGGGG